MDDTAAAAGRTCPRCGAARAAGPECPRCGVIYAKAAARPAPGAPPSEAPSEAPSEWETADQRLELRLRAFAIPATLVVAFLIVSSSFGHFVLRLFTMWVHELGHATAAWLCGYLAFPGPWFTPVAAQRSLLFAALVLVGLGAGAFWAYRTERRGLALALGAVALAQVCCTALLSADRAMQLILFMGDGGMLILGALLMLTVYARQGSALHRGWLRWGFLCIGAAAFADAFEQWWAARTDPDRIPFGMNEGMGLSDPSVLSERFGWSAGALVRRYVALGCVCLVLLAGVYVSALVRRVPARDRRS
jgi:rubredoxin